MRELRDLCGGCSVVAVGVGQHFFSGSWELVNIFGVAVLLYWPVGGNRTFSKYILAQESLFSLSFYSAVGVYLSLT